VGQSGFYRTAYSPEMFTPLAGTIDEGQLSPLDCLGVLDDTFALSQAGYARTSAALDLVARCGRYDDYNVWVTVASILGAIENVLADEPLRERLKGFARGVFGPLAQRVGWESKPTDGHLDALLRSLLLGRMGHYGEPSTVDEARQRFRRFVEASELAPDIRVAVYTTVAEHGADAEYDALLKIYSGTDLQEERVRVLRALTRFRRPEIVRRALDFALSEHVRRQDAYVILSGFGGNPIGRPLAWEFIKRHWSELTTRYSDGGLGLMTRVIEGSTTGFSTSAALKDVQQFFKTHRAPGTERTIKQSLETITATIRWAKRDTADIRGWLAAH